MEYGLRRVQLSSNEFEKCCLNPCFNGIWSATYEKYNYSMDCNDVLILVLMEYGLRLFLGYDQVQGGSRLNPCFNGIWSAT